MLASRNKPAHTPVQHKRSAAIAVCVLVCGLPAHERTMVSIYTTCHACLPSTRRRYALTIRPWCSICAHYSYITVHGFGTNPRRMPSRPMQPMLIALQICASGVTSGIHVIVADNCCDSTTMSRDMCRVCQKMTCIMHECHASLRIESDVLCIFELHEIKLQYRRMCVATIDITYCND
jgi:hypothetical protein